MKKLIGVIIVLVFLVNSVPVLAGAFSLTKIGGMQTYGAVYDAWHYEGTRPTFTGTGLSGESVVVVLDEQSYSTSVDENNNWSWAPEASLSAEKHYISFASAGSSFGFNLTVGSEIPEGITAPEATNTPVAGGIAPVLLISSLGSTLLGASYLLRRKV